MHQALFGELAFDVIQFKYNSVKNCCLPDETFLNKKSIIGRILIYLSPDTT